MHGTWPRELCGPELVQGVGTLYLLQGACLPRGTRHEYPPLGRAHDTLHELSGAGAMNLTQSERKAANMFGSPRTQHHVSVLLESSRKSCHSLYRWGSPRCFTDEKTQACRAHVTSLGDALQVAQAGFGPEPALFLVSLREAPRTHPPGTGQGQCVPPLLLQLVGQVYLLLPHALHQEPGPMQLLLCFCNILGPE